ncbi:MAG: hypothetical protein QG635_1847 [Bacteroidota bacterium]|nr:hypothetical protein [Bacteroidota bacterium]
MAFLKKEKKKSGTYLRIVESFRSSSGKSVHRTLYNLGKAEDYSKHALKSMGMTFLELAGIDVSLLENKELLELARYNYGFIQIYNRILQIYGIDKLIAEISNKKKLNFNLYQSLLLMIAEHLNEPSSKLSSYNNQSEYIGLERLDIHSINKCLERLYENQEKIQKLICQQGRNLFNQQLDIVFYNVITYYSDSEKEDDFRRSELSSDDKIGNTGIVFGMLIDKDKNPVGYRLFTGEYYEENPFSDAVRKLKQEYSIDTIISVADHRMMSGANKKLLNSEEMGCEYIIGEQLKNFPQLLQDKILDRSKYSKTWIIDDGEEIELEYYEIEHEGKRVLTTYSEKRAHKDRHEREEKLEKAGKLILSPSQSELIMAGHFLRKNEKSQYEFDEAKIERSEKFDGFISISTNTKDMTESAILEAYKQLNKIEQMFRTFKSCIEMRPMFHWTQKRIEGHLCLCYICFTLLNYLQQRLRSSGLKTSENKLRKTVRKMQLSLIEQNGERFYLRSRLDEAARMILKELNLRELPDIIGEHCINQYISIA